MLLLSCADTSRLLQRMVWDTKLNPMQLTAGKLQRLLVQHKEAGDTGRCRLRTPRQRLS